MTVHRVAGNYANLTSRAHDHQAADPEGAVDHDDLSAATLAAYVADDESAAYAGAPAALADAALRTDLNALRVAVENLRAAVEDLRTVHS